MFNGTTFYSRCTAEHLNFTR